MKRYELRITQQGNGGVMIPDETGGWVMYRSVKELETLVAQQAAVIEQMREALERCTKFTQEDYDALALQPCPEVLNKVRAEAVRELYHWYMDQDVFNHLGEAAIETFIAQRIEQGAA